MFSPRMQFLIFAFVLASSVLASSMSDQSSCNYVGDEIGAAGSNLLQVRRSKFDAEILPVEVSSKFVGRHSSLVHMHGAGIGDTATLDQGGFEQVVEMCCTWSMIDFIKRIVEEEGMKVCDSGWVSGVAGWYDCADDEQEFTNLLDAIRRGPEGPCPGLALVGEECKKMADSCPTSSATLAPCDQQQVQSSATLPPTTLSPTTTPPSTTLKPSTTTLPPTTTTVPPTATTVQPTTTVVPLATLPTTETSAVQLTGRNCVSTTGKCKNCLSGTKGWCMHNGLNNNICSNPLQTVKKLSPLGRACPQGMTHCCRDKSCRPCLSSDGPKCTHPGNANQAWCDSRCNGEHDSLLCVRSHCFCPKNYRD